MATIFRVRHPKDILLKVRSCDYRIASDSPFGERGSSCVRFSVCATLVSGGSGSGLAIYADLSSGAYQRVLVSGKHLAQ